ncbi:MAG: DNA polymerase III subunit gamma/tau, partial [Chlorobia bacterium]|nr:DNA polymerase III subunit gamma/tau [Fimbriimonadaceae bacterium]
RMIAEGSCPDVQEFDAASEAGVDDIRDAIVDNVQYMPMMCRYKIYIIDEVHDLSGKAFDALLKTVEEPPAHVIFILATTEFHKVPPTIRSRCQKFEFHRGSLPDLVKRLQYVADQENASIEPAAINAIARMADGGYRDALTLLEQAMLTSDGKITLNHIYDQLGLVSEEMVDGIIGAMKLADVPKIIELLNEISRLGRDPRSLLESMLHRMGDLTRAAYGIDLGGTGDSAQEAALHASAAQFGREFLLSLRASLSDAHKEIRDISLPRLWLEAELIRIAMEDHALLSEAPKQVIAKVEPQLQAVVSTKVQEPEKAKPPTKVEASEVVAKPVSTGNPELDRVALAWHEAVAELSIVSKLMASKLVEAKVDSVDGTKAYIEFSRQLDFEWVKDSPKRLVAVVDALKKRLGDDWKVEMGVGKRAAKAKKEPQAVELPLEGQKLADSVREIFGAN